jgi:tripartite-type tricarboxylate transporter receptor subunit TctC
MIVYVPCKGGLSAMAQLEGEVAITFNTVSPVLNYVKVGILHAIDRSSPSSHNTY